MLDKLEKARVYEQPQQAASESTNKLNSYHRRVSTLKLGSKDTNSTKPATAGTLMSPRQGFNLYSNRANSR